MTTAPPKLLTVGELAKHFGLPVHRIEYILSTRPHIQPRAYAGRLRLYSHDERAEIRHELNAISARRSRREVSHEK